MEVRNTQRQSLPNFDSFKGLCVQNFPGASIRKCKTRIEKIGGLRVDTEPTTWGLDAQVWNLSWTGEEVMKKGIPILKKAGFERSKIYQGQP